jgi:hypothetical protein
MPKHVGPLQIFDGSIRFPKYPSVDSSTTSFLSVDTSGNLEISGLGSLKYETVLSAPNPSDYITHDLGVKYPIVTVIDLGDNNLVFAGVEYLDTSTLKLDLEGYYPLTSDLKVVVNGGEITGGGNSSQLDLDRIDASIERIDSSINDLYANQGGGLNPVAAALIFG